MPFRKAFIVRSPVLRAAFCFPSTMESGIGPRGPPRKKIFFFVAAARPPTGGRRPPLAPGPREPFALCDGVGNSSLPCLDKHALPLLTTDDPAIDFHALSTNRHHH